jgi:thiamine-monophosphate kinase
MPGVSSPEEIGHKALAVNLSDVAAMGGEPLWALISLLLPSGTDAALLDGVYAGMRALARRYGVALVGGNVASTDGPLTIDLTLLGKVRRGAAVLRSGGRPGDLLLVTGELGAAAAGVLASVSASGSPVAAARPRDIPPDVLERARRAMAAPEPRVAEGRALAASGVVTAMLDVSDGLAADLAHLCEGGDVGATVDVARMPVSPVAAAIAAAYGRDPLDLALTGGEDYELLFSVAPGRVDDALAAVQSARGVATVLGELTPAEHGLRLREPDGSVRPLIPGGWDHLRKSL